MATLILTAVGTAVGGPIGGLIGATIGQQVDHAVLGSLSPAREGPRLKELDVQTSSYGTSIPAIFGAMRIAGTVIWASDLIEKTSHTGGGKNSSGTTNYSYSVNMAVALSSRPCMRIGRIWADGNLLRGAQGDFKTPTIFRFHDGHGDQALDTLLASAEATGKCPAHRGLAYCVFEELQLADFGNRIPSLTFEIFERETSVPVNDIARNLSAGLLEGENDEHLIGYAAQGNSGRAALSPLIEIMPLRCVAQEDRLILRPSNANTVTLPAVQFAAKSANKNLPYKQQKRTPKKSNAHSIALRYYDPSRDFQTGLQRSRFSNQPSAAKQLDFPAAIDAAGALRLADRLELSEAGQTLTFSGHVPISETSLNLGDRFKDTGSEYCWQIDELEHFQGTSHFIASLAMDSPPAITAQSEAGRNVQQADIPSGQTEIAILDLPALDMAEPIRPVVVIAAAGTESGWRSAALSQRQGSQLTDIGQTARPAIMGHALNIPIAHSAFFTDNHSSIDIRLLNDGMAFPLSVDSGLCWFEGEIISYQSATPMGGNIWRLSQLRRGLYRSQAWMTGHQIGDRCIFLNRDQLLELTNSNIVMGQNLIIEAMGLGDNVPASDSIAILGNALRPFAPVHGAYVVQPDGSILAQWVRRARIDYGWSDNVDQPIIEESELYIISMMQSGALIASWTSDQPRFVIPSAESILFQAQSGSTITIEIRQLGRFASSDPLKISK